ncbi:MAG: hypothetical protein L0Z62_27985 [Gemmataceae bacterium]|nr:hypothetical protein [Gemmataceae bacterium]
MSALPCRLLVPVALGLLLPALVLSGDPPRLTAHPLAGCFFPQSPRQATSPDEERFASITEGVQVYQSASGQLLRQLARRPSPGGGLRRGRQNPGRGGHEPGH